MYIRINWHKKKIKKNNKIKKMKKKIKFFIFIYFHILLINCQKCKDDNCVQCSRDGNYCYICKEGFIKHYSQCGLKCKSIRNCQLCSVDYTKCIKCKANCSFNGILCDCTERYVLILVCTIIAISTIIITILCLLNTSWRRSINNLYILSGHIRPSIFSRRIFNRNPLHEEENNEIERKIKQVKIISEFNRFKIKEDKNIFKKKCFICKNNDYNLKLSCGCYICFECEKVCAKTNICLNCNKKISSMQQVSCSICFCNKKQISTFNCPCKTVICKECYLKWRKQHNFCPSCREPIFDNIIF